MRKMKKVWFGLLCMLLCVMSMYATAFADEDTKLTEPDYKVSLENWNRRIYDLSFNVKGMELKGEQIRVYVGSNYHLTDSWGDILAEGNYIDANGDVTGSSKGGRISRDVNGWYVLWEKPDFAKMEEQHIFVQANVEFAGGNNQTLGVQGLSGIYASKDDDKPCTVMAFEDIVVNVASEVDISNTDVPVMAGMNVDSSAFLAKSAVKMDAVYGDLRDLPIAVQWYRIQNNGGDETVEVSVGEPMTRMPYHVPESEYDRIVKGHTEYVVKVFYNGEVSTEESKKNTDGHENKVSDTEPMDTAMYKTELVKGRIELSVQLDHHPYNYEQVSNSFRFRLYRFEQQNQVITASTPYTVYTVTFEKGATALVQTIAIDNLEDGWYTLVPETPYGDFSEKTEERFDNRNKDGQTGSAAGVDFHIGQIVDNKYSWEMIRYQGQDPESLVGDNFFKVTYEYKETLYGVTYNLNVPKGEQVQGKVPIDQTLYREGAYVNVADGKDLTIDGWQFAGWSFDAGDGQYFKNDVLYATQSVHGIPVKKQAVMAEGGITLYAKWIPVYAVTYHGNTSTEGKLPVDTKGTAANGSNLYYNGDRVIVQAPGNLAKKDDDGVKYEFMGWSLNQDGSGVRYYEGDRVFVDNSNVNFYAQWNAIGTDKFAVNYIPVIPKGASMLGQVPKDGDKYAEGNVVKVMGRGTMTVQHYLFAGWSLTSNEDGLYVKGEEIFGTNDIGDTVTREETVMKNQGLSFYSRWIPLYQVTYHTTLKDVELVDNKEYQTGDEIKILGGENLKRDGYSFVGWNTKEDCSGKIYEPGSVLIMEDGCVDLYAQWEKLADVEADVEDSKTDTSESGPGDMTLLILAVIGTACITACVVYWIMRKRIN